MNRSENMRRIKNRDTAPEMLRRLVHGMGHRHRLHRADLPGKPDLAFMLSHAPRSNAAYWSPKLERNRTRDAAHAAAFEALGWKYCYLCHARSASAAIAVLF